MWQRAKKTLTFLTLLSMLGGLLAGCGDAATTVPATATAGTGATDATATMGTGGATDATATMGTGGATGMTMPADCPATVELQYWNPFTGPDGPFMGKLVDSFNAANPNIKVTMTTQADLGTQLGTAAASNTLPDITIVNEDVVATYAFRNIIRPMDDVATMMGMADGSDFPAVAWKAGEVAGKRYAIPLSFVAMTMYYNQDLLTAAGLNAPPTNAAEFDAAAAAMTKDGNRGFQITTGFPVQQIFQMLLHQYGGTEFSEDGTKATWNSEAGVKALQWMVDAQQKYSEPNLEVDADLNSFKQGTVGMIWNGIWQVPNVTGESVGFKSGFGPPPQIGDQPAIWAGGPLLALPVRPTADKCKDTASAMLIKYLIDNSVEWAKAGNIPASNKARNSAEFKALPQASFVTALDNPVFPPAIPGIGDAFAPLGEAIGGVMGGKEADLKKALDTAAERSNAILEQNRTNFGTAPKSP